MSAGNARPQLRLHHLFVLTAVMAVLLAINGPQRNYQNDNVSPSQLQVSFWLGINVLNQILMAAAITSLAYGFFGYRRGLPFFNQPGHWLLVEISLTALLSIPPGLAYRFISIPSRAAPSDAFMAIAMITTIYSLLFLGVGRAAINIYLGLTKCKERRWRLVFYAKAVTWILLGLGGLVVIPLVTRAVRRDRRDRLPRDASHWCGVGVQLGLSAEWHLNFCKSWRGRLIWIEKAILAKREL